MLHDPGTYIYIYIYIYIYRERGGGGGGGNPTNPGTDTFISVYPNLYIFKIFQNAFYQNVILYKLCIINIFV